MQLPPEFIRTIQDTFGDEGRAFLNALPDLIAEASRRWNLSEIHPVPNLSYNFVAFANRPSPTDFDTFASFATQSSAQGDVVLKIGVPNRELTSEMTALRLFDGRGAVRLLEEDAEHAMFLLERLKPGNMLVTLKDDEQATHIAAEVMLNLWKPAPSNAALIQLSDWFKGFGRLRARFEGGTGPLEKSLVERAEGVIAEFFAEDEAPMLIHGDLHHFNILASERGCAVGVKPAALRSGGTTPPGWLAIDPKGVVGPAAYEVGPLLINPWDELGMASEMIRITERRISVLSERLGFERERLLAWGLAHAVLSAWWSIEDKANWEYALGCAEIFSRMQI